MDPAPRLPSSPAQAWARALRNIAPLLNQPHLTLSAVIDRVADRCPSHVALSGETYDLTYLGLRDLKNQFAQWTLQLSAPTNAIIALFMKNCPEYAAIWLGVTHAGATAALINSNLVGDALAHAIRSSGATHIILSSDLIANLETVTNALTAEHWVYDRTGATHVGFRSLDLTRFSTQPPAENAPDPMTGKRTALLIFTSGTTGLPKAARLSHYRILEWSLWFAGMMDVTPSDRLYDCLPLYHSTGGVAALGALLVSGGTVVLRERFSSSRFWDDVVDSRSTLFVYIGELCRYLVDMPSHDREQQHTLRLCCGNGLREDVWHRFTSRFEIPQVLEFYASTEGNVSLYNCEGQPGAVGRLPRFLAHRLSTALIECDLETEEPRRGDDGLCIRSNTGEIGEAIGRITSPDSDGRQGPDCFEGYTDADATQRKVLRHVFANGDAWFRTGDLMRQDDAGFWYFVDRMGDTFRWKGENVSTSQVEAALRDCPGVTGAIVYGVEIPGAEGRAGMAALTVSPGFCTRPLYTALANSLPAYARPLYLRICKSFEVTATFKPLKVNFVRQGYDPNMVTDPMFVEDRNAGMYRPIFANVDSNPVQAVPPASTVKVVPVTLRASSLIR